MKNKIQGKLPKILTEVGEKKELMKILDASHVTVREALRGNISTPLALRIRKAAIARGGYESTGNPIKHVKHEPDYDDNKPYNTKAKPNEALLNKKRFDQK